MSLNREAAGDWRVRLASAPVVAVIRHNDPKPLVEACLALAAGGVKFIEITLTVPDAFQIIRAVSQAAPEDVVVGAGTVMDGESAERSVAAGAQFLVSPTLRTEVVQVGKGAKALIIPGALSPSEILAAWEQGADVVKVFPARLGGPIYLQDVLGPFPQLRLMPSGGVNFDNAASFLEAGAIAVSMGGALVDAKILREQRYLDLADRARGLLAWLKAARSA